MRLLVLLCATLIFLSSLIVLAEDSETIFFPLPFQVYATPDTPMIADENFSSGLKNFENYKNNKIKKISHRKHAPILYHHGYKTEFVVVALHGLYESPRTINGLGRAFYNHGMNVMMPLLPGNWDRTRQTTDKVTYKDWLKEVDISITMAKKLGNKVILMGFSLGGILAVEAAIKHKAEIKGLFVLAPVFSVTERVSLAASLGRALGFDANEWEKMPVDGVNIPYYSLKLAAQLFALSYYINSYRLGFTSGNSNVSRASHVINGGLLAPLIKAPTFVIYSQNDEAINPAQVERFFKQLNTPKQRIVYSDVGHTALPKDRPDANRTRPNEYNPNFKSMANAMLDFFETHIR